MAEDAKAGRLVEFALVNGVRTSATPNARAQCPQCTSEVLAKCGQINVHHWAHVVGEDCDPWSEPETPWHRHWKSFGHLTEQTIANHRADIITSSGLIVELQHSSLSVNVIQEREACYGSKLRWLFDGTEITVSAPNGEFLSSTTSDNDERQEGEYFDDPQYGRCMHPRVRVVDGDYGLTKHWWNGAEWEHYGDVRLCLRNREDKKSKEGWEIVTFRWKHPRKHYGMTSRPTYVDLPGFFVLKVSKIHLEGGPPYGGWGYLVPRATVEGWLR